MSCFISQQYCSHASDYLLSWCQLLAKSSTLPALGTGTCGDSRGRGQTFAGMVTNVSGERLGMGANACRDDWRWGQHMQGLLGMMVINVCPHAIFYLE